MVPGSSSIESRLKERLLARGASVRDVDLFLDVRGLSGGPPLSLRAVDTDLSPERVRKVVAAIENGPLRQLLADRLFLASIWEMLEEGLSGLDALCPGDEEFLASRLPDSFSERFGSPGSLVRLADLFGVPHQLRISQWRGTAKYRDPAGIHLSSASDKARVATVSAVVPLAMPEVFDPFISLARRISRGSGFVSVGRIADRFGVERGVPLSAAEAEAFLRPFAVSIGRHGGEEWYVFANAANEFLRKAATHVELLGKCSFSALREAHVRRNRSAYAEPDLAVPESVLKAALEVSGYVVDGDSVAPARKAETSHAPLSPVQAEMLRAFQRLEAESASKHGVKRGVLLGEMLRLGIRESTARMHLANQVLFRCRRGYCKINGVFEGAI